MKLCFSTLGCYDKEFDAIINFAKNNKITGLEIRGINSEMSNDKIVEFQDENVNSTIHKFNEHQIVPLILGTSCKFHKDDNRDVMIEKSYKEMQIAKKLGFKAIRVFGDKIENEETVDKVANALNTITNYAHKVGIKIYLEVHGDFNTVEVLEKVLNKIEFKDSFSLIWDIYHTNSKYGKNWKEFYLKMKPYIEHVHIKDSVGVDLCLPGKGELEIIPIIKYMLEDGYNGYFSLEWEKKWFPELDEFEVALNHFINLLKENRLL